MIIQVLDSRTGATPVFYNLLPAGSHGDGGDVVQLRLSRTGVIAFTYHGDWPGHGNGRFVATFGATGLRLLDTGAGIRLHSLIRAGSFAYWRHGKALRSAFIG